MGQYHLSPPQTNMIKVYAVGVIKANLTNPQESFIKNSRLWFISSSFEYAESAILTNSGDLFEYYYNLALIEEIILAGTIDKDNDPPEVVHYYPTPTQWWYKATYSDEPTEHNPVVTSIAKPEVIENIVCFWVG